MIDPANYREISYSCPTCGVWTSVLIPLTEKPASYFAYMIECRACRDRRFAPKPWYARLWRWLRED